jgi:hypothetical protein
MAHYKGGCHCGNLLITFSSDTTLDALQVRSCKCGFCRRHGVRTVTDPSGEVVVAIKDPALVHRYTFGQSVAEFLVCRDCGNYVAAVMTASERTVATLNINMLDDNPFGDRVGHPADYAAESAEGRRARRLRMWTPTTLNTAP